MVELALSGKMCPECPPGTESIIDATVADVICTGCGLVLEGRCIDEGREWRNFASEGVGQGDDAYNSKERADHSAVDADALGYEGGTTVAGGDAMANTLQRYQRQAGQLTDNSAEARTHRHLSVCSGKLRELTRRLDLNECIFRRCEDIVQELSQRSALPAQIRNQSAFFNAIVYLACREEHVGREARELAAASATTETLREKLNKQIQHQVVSLSSNLAHYLSHEQTSLTPPEELMGRYVSRLQLSHDLVAPATHIVEQAYKHDFILATPQVHGAVVAASIFVVAWLRDVENKPTLEEAASTAKVSEASMHHAYAMLHPVIRRLLPEAFRCRLPGGLDALPLPVKRRRVARR